MNFDPSATAALLRRIYLFGAGVRARLVHDVVSWELAEKFRIEGYFDDFQSPGQQGPGGQPILGNFSHGFRRDWKPGELALIATGTKRSIVRCELLARCAELRIPVTSVIAHSARISPTAQLGPAAFVMPGAFVGANVVIGSLFCAHGGTTIEHDCQVGHNVMLGPGVTTAGGCSIGDCTFLGAGVTVAPNIRIGKGTLVGTGAVVVRDLPDHVIAYGNPARPRREVREGDEVPAAGEFQALTSQQWQLLHSCIDHS